MRRLPIGLAFGGLVLIGLGGGAGGVLIPYQMADYHVDKVVVGLLFFAYSGGYVLSGLANGPMIHRLGVRGHLVSGSAVYLVTALGIGLHPGYGGLVGATAALGFGSGVLDSGLNAYIASLPRHTTLLNLLHAFYGIGALVGPVLATQLVHRHVPWQDTYLVLAACVVPLIVGFAVALPARTAVPDESAGSPLRLAFGHRAVWLGALFLFLCVGVEITIGNWGFTLLTQGQGRDELTAGYVVSGYWLGLTAGRFLISAATSRAGIGPAAMLYGCLAGAVGSVVLIWVGPAPFGFALLGFFLGPMFPTTIAVTPSLVPVRLVPAAIGLMIGSSVIGGGLFPFVAGALAQRFGLLVLLPYVLVLAIAQTAGWWAIARRLREPVDSVT